VNNKKIPYKSTTVLLIIATALSVGVNAEGLSLDEGNKGLTTVQKSVDSSGQSTQSEQPGTDSVTDVNHPTAVQGSLTDTLVKTLGITTQQAQGGTGALFQVAKGKLDAGQFADLSKAVPEMDSLLNAAPKQSAGLAGSESSGLDGNNPYGNLAGLASTFKMLNLSPDKVDEFVPVVVNYVEARGGALTADTLQSVLYGGL
jgi:hypothetical protein